MKKTNYILLLVLFLGIEVKAQDIHFSQILSTPLLVNPANAGAIGDQRVYLNYRDQWRSVTTPYKTFMASFETEVMGSKTKNNKLTAGGYIYSDKAGDAGFVNNALNLVVSYRVAITSKSYFIGGIQGGVGQRGINDQNFRWDNQFNGVQYDESIAPSETVDVSNTIIGDYAGGISWVYSKNPSTLSSSNARYIKLGLATYHVNQPKLFADRKYSRFVFNGDAYFGINNTKIVLHPAVYLFVNKQSTEIMFGSNVKYILKEESKYTNLVKGAAITFGLFHRVKDAVILSAGLEQGKYAIGMSYDINTSKLRAASNMKGGFEIYLRFINPNPFRGKGGGGKARFN